MGRGQQAIRRPQAAREWCADDSRFSRPAARIVKGKLARNRACSEKADRHRWYDSSGCNQGKRTRSVRRQIGLLSWRRGSGHRRIGRRAHDTVDVSPRTQRGTELPRCLSATRPAERSDLAKARDLFASQPGKIDCFRGPDSGLDPMEALPSNIGASSAYGMPPVVRVHTAAIAGAH
jgi:hypothetical protein